MSCTVCKKDKTAKKCKLIILLESLLPNIDQVSKGVSLYLVNWGYCTDIVLVFT